MAPTSASSVELCRFPSTPPRCGDKYRYEIDPRMLRGLQRPPRSIYSNPRVGGDKISPWQRSRFSQLLG